MTQPGAAAVSDSDALAPYRDKPVYLCIYEKSLREQLKLIFSALKFTRVKELSAGSGYLESVKLLAQHLIQNDGLFLVSPPQAAVANGGKVRVSKDLTDFFSGVKVLLSKARRQEHVLLAKCVPVFQEIQFTQKREMTLLQLSKFGIPGAFILKKQEPLGSLTPQLRKIRLQEQVMERYQEIRNYLVDFLPHMEGARGMAQERLEEMELSERKAKADWAMQEAEKAKKARDWERAVLCYKRAIDIYPHDPNAYMESGKVYVRLQKYPRALQRFAQAQELAEGTPEPNKHIGLVRVLQVQERLEQGDSPTSEETMSLLQDALDNFDISLKKAMAIRPLTPDEEEGARSRETVARIAGDMMKLGLKETLGKRHPVVNALGNMARSAIEQVAPENMDQLPASHQLFMGLAALDAGKYEEAERLLFRAVQDKGQFAEACDDIIYMGTVVRKAVGAPQAIGIYEKLLALDPPRKPAVFYNLSVAFCVEGRELEGGGAIVQAVYLEPSLPEDAAFYKNVQIHKVLAKVLQLFGTLEARSRKVQVQEVLRRAVSLQEKIETAIQGAEDAAALRLVWHVASEMPDFFKREPVAASNVLQNFIKSKVRVLSASDKPATRTLGEFFAKHLEWLEGQQRNKRLLAHLHFKSKMLHALDGASPNEALAANFLTRAVLCHPESISSQELYASAPMLRLGKEIHSRLSAVDAAKVGGGE